MNITNQSIIQNGSYEIPWYNPYVIKDVPLKIAQTVIGTILNAFALVFLIQMKKKTFSHCLFISLSTSDLINSSFFSGLSIAGFTYLQWPLGNVVCFIYQLLASAQYAVSNLTVLLISVNRFILLNRVIKNGENLTNLKIFLLALCWILPYVYIPSMLVVFLNNGLLDYGACAINYPFLFVFIHNTLVNLLPGFISMSTNILSTVNLIIKWRKKSKLVLPRSRITQANGAFNSRLHCNTNADSLVSASFGIEENVSASANGDTKSKTNAVKYRKKLNNEFKAVICILFVVLNIAINEYPCLILWMLLVRCYDCISLELFYGSLRMVFFFPIINPIILFVFNQSLQNQIVKTVKSFF